MNNHLTPAIAQVVRAIDARPIGRFRLDKAVIDTADVVAQWVAEDRLSEVGAFVQNGPDGWTITWNRNPEPLNTERDET